MPGCAGMTLMGRERSNRPGKPGREEEDVGVVAQATPRKMTQRASIARERPMRMVIRGVVALLILVAAFWSWALAGPPGGSLALS
jgi:hypothetical protein